MQECLEEKKVSVRKLVSFLSGLPCCVDKNLMLLSAKRNEFERAKDITDIFFILKEECSSFLNYHIFEIILAGFGIKYVHDDLKYPAMLECYINKHKVSEFIQVHPLLNECSDSTKELVIILDIDAICKLCKIVDLGEAVARVMKLEPYSLLIHEIGEACVIVTFLIPSPVANVIFMGNATDIFSSEQKKQFRKLSVKVLICNDYEFSFTQNYAVDDEHGEEVVREVADEEMDICSGRLHVMLFSGC